jgi:hypothetical protein
MALLAGIVTNGTTIGMAARMTLLQRYPTAAALNLLLFFSVLQSFTSYCFSPTGMAGVYTG